MAVAATAALTTDNPVVLSPVDCAVWPATNLSLCGSKPRCTVLVLPFHE